LRSNTYLFDVQKLEPRVGNVYRFFIHQIAERGLDPPHSNLTAISMHFGYIFTSHTRKAAPQHRPQPTGDLPMQRR
jgi:hypothetical protein